METERAGLGCSDTHLKFQAHVSIPYCDLKFSGKIVWSLNIIFTKKESHSKTVLMAVECENKLFCVTTPGHNPM